MYVIKINNHVLNYKLETKEEAMEAFQNLHNKLKTQIPNLTITDLQIKRDNNGEIYWFETPFFNRKIRYELVELLL